MLPTQPVLLLLFNRPDYTQELVSILRSVRPQKVYVAIDGPRANKPEDAQKVAVVREIARSIDWTSQIQFLVREENLGCGKSVSSALNWFFEQEEQGIILEDDTHPSTDFFPFCSEMLARYADNERVATIGGHSFVPFNLRHPAGYFFSKYIQIWGWATWRRFWKTYDFKLASLPYEEWGKVIDNNAEGVLEKTYWLHCFGEVWKNTVDTWDYQVQFCVWRNQQVCINAGTNLITNVGFREDATHTPRASHLAFRKTNPLIGPFSKQAIEVDVEIDRKNFLWQLLVDESMLSYLVRKTDLAYSYLEQQNEQLKTSYENLNNQWKELVCTYNNPNNQHTNHTHGPNRIRNLVHTLKKRIYQVNNWFLEKN